MTTRQYARLDNEWIDAIGLSPSALRHDSLRRTKAAHDPCCAASVKPMTNMVRYLGLRVCHNDEAERLGEQAIAFILFRWNMCGVATLGDNKDGARRSARTQKGGDAGASS